MQTTLSKPTPVAVTTYDGRAHVARLQERARTAIAVRHPLLDVLQHLPVRRARGALAHVLGQYYLYSKQFTSLLTAAIETLPAPRHRAVLTANLHEEQGAGGASHTELFANMLVGMGIDPSALRPAPAVRRWVAAMRELCHAHAAGCALGALGLATEGIVPPIYSAFLSAAKRAWPQQPAGTWAFLATHVADDDAHAEALRTVAAELCAVPAQRAALAEGMQKALDARAAFFDACLAHIRDNSAFVDTRRNRAGLQPRQAWPVTRQCKGAAQGCATAFSQERGHRVESIVTAAKTMSCSLGHLDAGQGSRRHRHAYEVVTYIIEGSGTSRIGSKIFRWLRGDVLTVPPWCWHEHCAETTTRYLTVSNMPLLERLGQTVLRQEEGGEA